MTKTERRHLLENAAATLAKQFDMMGNLDIDTDVIQGCLDEMVKPEDNHLLQQTEATQQFK